MIRRLAALVGVLGCAASLTALQQAPAPAGGLILGRVVDAQSNAPIGGAVVSIQPTQAGTPRIAEPRVMSDAEGRFLFRDLPEGAFVITAATGGGNLYAPNGFIVSGSMFPTGVYLEGGVGQRRPGGPIRTVELGRDQLIGDLVIRLWKAAAVSGRVIDEVGEPLVNQVVGVVQLNSQGRFLNGPTVRTDDTGAYRLAGLMPGAYVVFVPQTQVSMPISIGEEIAAAPPDTTVNQRFSLATAPRPGTGGVRIGSSFVTTTPDFARFSADALISNALAPVREGDAYFVYPTTFFPAETRPSEASRINLQSGEDRMGADVQLKPARAGSISGVLMDEVGPVPNVGLRLMPADLGRDGAMFEAAATASDSRGAFSFPAVPAGQYTIVVWRSGAMNPQAPPRRLGEADGAWSIQKVSAGARPGENITVTMRPPVNLTAQVIFDGSSDRPSAERLRTSFMTTVFQADPASRLFGPSPGGFIDVANGGRILIKSISPPGRFFMGPATLPPPWTLQSITIAGRNVTDAAFDIGEADISNVIITYTDRPSALSGTVALSAADTGVSVFMFPADRTRWADARLSRRTFRVTRTTATGAFNWTTVPPGEYLVAAVQDDVAGAWPDEPFIAKLAELATPVRISANQQASMSLKVGVVK